MGGYVVPANDHRSRDHLWSIGGHVWAKEALYFRLRCFHFVVGFMRGIDDDLVINRVQMFSGDRGGSTPRKAVRHQTQASHRRSVWSVVADAPS